MNRYKKIIAVLLAVLMCLCLCACGSEKSDVSSDNADNSDNIDSMICEGLYLKAKNAHMIVIENNSPVVMHADEQLGDKAFDNLSDGDKIKITCDAISMTYPGSTKIYELELIEKGSFSDIYQETYNNLVEMGWIEN